MLLDLDDSMEQPLDTFSLGSHNFTVTALGSCGKWALGNVLLGSQTSSTWIWLRYYSISNKALDDLFTYLLAPQRLTIGFRGPSPGLLKCSGQLKRYPEAWGQLNNSIWDIGLLVKSLILRCRCCSCAYKLPATCVLEVTLASLPAFMWSKSSDSGVSLRRRRK